MKPPTKKHAAPEIIDALADLFSAAPKAIQLRSAKPPIDGGYSVNAAGHRFLADYNPTASVGPLAIAINRLKRSSEITRGAGLPLVVVPYMGDVGRNLCQRSGIAWIDLSGNAAIAAPGLKIRIEGRPNRFLDRGRPPNVFAAKSSRITRQLLLQPERFQTQADLARQTGLDDGYVSKIVRRLEQEHFVVANDAAAVLADDPNLLLDAWQGAYDFNRHRVVKGHVSSRSGDELLQRLAERFSQEKLAYAATGLGAAWLYCKFAAFRLVTIYLPTIPSRSLLKQIEFSDEPKGANLWLVVPDDEGVFQGSQELAGITCVSPVQTYLDLTVQPERAKDAAVELRRTHLKWSRHGA